MRTIKFTVLLGVILSQFTVQAADNRYFKLGAGIDWPRHEIDVPVYFSDIEVRTQTGTGYWLHCSGGYRLLEKLCIAGELEYRSSRIKDVNVTRLNIIGMGVDGGSGRNTSLSFMTNMWHDVFFVERFSLFVGGGIGVAQVSLRDFSISTFPVVPNPPMTKQKLIDDGDWQFAYQAGLGMSYSLSSSYTISLDYRYFATLDLEFTDVGGNRIGANHSRSNLLLAIKYWF